MSEVVCNDASCLVNCYSWVGFLSIFIVFTGCCKEKVTIDIVTDIIQSIICNFKGVTIFEVAEARAGDKRKREKPGDPGDIEGYKGKIARDKVITQCLLWFRPFSGFYMYYHHVCVLNSGFY